MHHCAHRGPPVKGVAHRRAHGDPLAEGVVHHRTHGRTTYGGARTVVREEDHLRGEPRDIPRTGVRLRRE